MQSEQSLTGRHLRQRISDRAAAVGI